MKLFKIIFAIFQDYLDAMRLSTKICRCGVYLTQASISTLLICTPYLSAIELSELDAFAIGQKVWMNQCNQTIEGMLVWNPGEEFASLGIGHFIWYPIGREQKFVQTFPAFVQFLKDHRIQLPYWLTPKTTCPWHSRYEFERGKRSSKMRDLQNLLTSTLFLQALFMSKQLSSAESRLTQDLSQSNAKHVQQQIDRLSQVPSGLFALIDYLSFQGEGTDSIEQYEGKGWGILQVLLRMPGNTEDPLEEFISSAQKTLSDRVEFSPPHRQERQLLTGWLKRIESYRSRAI